MAHDEKGGDYLIYLMGNIAYEPHDLSASLKENSVHQQSPQDTLDYMGNLQIIPTATTKPWKLSHGNPCHKAPCAQFLC